MVNKTSNTWTNVLTCMNVLDLYNRALQLRDSTILLAWLTWRLLSNERGAHQRAPTCWHLLACGLTWHLTDNGDSLLSRWLFHCTPMPDCSLSLGLISVVVQSNVIIASLLVGQTMFSWPHPKSWCSRLSEGILFGDNTKNFWNQRTSGNDAKVLEEAWTFFFFPPCVSRLAS